MPESTSSMKWVVVAIAGLILLASVAVSIFREFDVKPAYYLFGTVGSFVFGAAVINKFK